VSQVHHMLSELQKIMSMSRAYSDFEERHNIRSTPILSVVQDDTAKSICQLLAPRITGKTVVEVGGGVGLLSLAMASVAKRVYCIEANPTWAAAWTQILIEEKPRNMSFLFGAADEFVGCIRGDVAVVCTHSDVEGMKLLGGQFAPDVVDVYGEMIDANPAAFDPLATRLRSSA
jgi:hypothetical protein